MKSMATKVNRQRGTQPPLGHSQITPNWHIYRTESQTFFGYSQAEVLAKAGVEIARPVAAAPQPMSIAEQIQQEELARSERQRGARSC